MLLALIAGLQVSGPPADPLPATGAAIPDRLQVARRCPTGGTGDEVVVCGRAGQEQYRLRPSPSPADKEGLPRAEAKVGSGTVGVRAEDATVGGFTSHRIMVGIKLPF